MSTVHNLLQVVFELESIDVEVDRALFGPPPEIQPFIQLLIPHVEEHGGHITEDLVTLRERQPLKPRNELIRQLVDLVGVGHVSHVDLDVVMPDDRLRGNVSDLNVKAAGGLLRVCHRSIFGILRKEVVIFGAEPVDSLHDRF